MQGFPISPKIFCKWKDQRNSSQIRGSQPPVWIPIALDEGHSNLQKQQQKPLVLHAEFILGLKRNPWRNQPFFFSSKYVLPEFYGMHKGWKMVRCSVWFLEASIGLPTVCHVSVSFWIIKTGEVHNEQFCLIYPTYTFEPVWVKHKRDMAGVGEGKNAAKATQEEIIAAKLKKGGIKRHIKGHGSFSVEKQAPRQCSKMLLISKLSPALLLNRGRQESRVL